MQTPNQHSKVLRLAIILWTATCVSAFIRYSGSHSLIHGTSLGNWLGLLDKLARINLITSTATSMLAFGGVLVFVAAFLGTGISLFMWLRVPSGPESGSSWGKPIYLASAFLAGEGVCSVIFFALGELRLLTQGHVVIIVACMVGLAVFQLRAYFGRHPLPPRLDMRGASITYGKVVLVLAALVLILALSYTTSRISFDATAIYFSDARITALTHSVRYFTEDPFLASIFPSVMNYAAIIELFGDQAARMYSWMSGLAFIVAGIALAEELGLSRRARIVLFALILTSTAILDLLGDGKIDLAGAAPALTAIYWMMVNAERKRSNGILSGFLVGIAMAARPFNILLLPSMILLLGLQKTALNRSTQRIPRYWVALEDIFWIGIGAAPWIAYILVSNQMLQGNPLAFMTSYTELRSGAWDASFPADRMWIYRLLYPLSVTFKNHGQSLGNVSPLFVGLAPVALLNSVRNKSQISGALLRVAVAALLTLLIWLVMTSMVFEIRYVLFLWIILYMPVSLWVDAALDDIDSLIRRLVRLSIVVVLIFISVRVLYISIDTYSPVDAQGNAHCFDLNRCTILEPVNQTAGPGERVLMLSPFRYYLRSDLFACSTSAKEYRLLVELSRSDTVAFWTEAYREGYTFVIYQPGYAMGHLYLRMTLSPSNTPSWLKLDPIMGTPGDDDVAYRLVAKAPPVSVERTCVKRGDSWQIQETSISPG